MLDAGRTRLGEIKEAWVVATMSIKAARVGWRLC